MTFEQWLKENEKYIEPADIIPWMNAAWDAAVEHKGDDVVVWVHPHRLQDILSGDDDGEPIAVRAQQPTPIWVPLKVQ